MEIRISHTFECDPRAYWETAWKADLEKELRAEAEVDFTLLEERVEGPVTFTRTRIAPRRELPLIAAKALGQKSFSYVQEVEANREELTTRWRVVPDILSTKIRCEGASRVVATPDGCERVIDGEIDVTVPLIGGAVERQIVAEITRSYDRAAEVIRRHLPRKD